ncbi:MAG: right-handed parallel beta-helix repeat-containing protein [Lachnospiraceae bacterium]|nr:right-handed parallel beta-helix repeat-containing protein [Lachnospiraceae bacterium]
MRTVRLAEYGILPDTDITLSLQELFSKYPEDTEFVFDEGDYFFSPHLQMRADYRISNSDRMAYRVMAIWMKEMKNCILRGNNTRLFLEGQMQVFTLDRCENIKIENFTVNWKKPLVAEGVVTACSGETVDVYVDPEKFPHRYANGTLEFDTGANEWYRIIPYTIAFEPHSCRVRRGTDDIQFTQVLELEKDHYRLILTQKKDIRVGDLLNLRHNMRIHAGIFSEKCRDLTVENVTFYSCGGLGCLAQFCHNLTYKGVHFVPDRAGGRQVSSGRDDGMHMTSNSGTITITECTFHALMDDPINVHGCCVTSNQVVNEKTLRCKYRHKDACGFHYWAEPGDQVVFISRDTMEPVEEAKVASYVLEDHETFLLTFQEPLSKQVRSMAMQGEALALDNLTHTAQFICTKNRFGSCRARGILVSTPKKVLIADNYFESSGSAILVAGDSNFWFESGACHDVEITRNIFTDATLTSEYQFCDGVISISPVVPAPVIDKPYHTNIRITDNVFDTADTPVLYGYSCEGLEFSRNRILKSPSADSWHKGRTAVCLQYCKKAVVKENEWVGNFGEFEACVLSDCAEVQSDLICNIIK